MIIYEIFFFYKLIWIIKVNIYMKKFKSSHRGLKKNNFINIIISDVIKVIAGETNVARYA